MIVYAGRIPKSNGSFCHICNAAARVDKAVNHRFCLFVLVVVPGASLIRPGSFRGSIDLWRFAGKIPNAEPRLIIVYNCPPPALFCAQSTTSITTTHAMSAAEQVQLDNFQSIFSLDGKVAVVTGGSRGLGLHAASGYTPPEGFKRGQTLI